jgi:hypothetical protein
MLGPEHPTLLGPQQIASPVEGLKKQLGKSGGQ